MSKRRAPGKSTSQRSAGTLALYRTEQRHKTVRFALRYGAFCFLALMSYRAIDRLAGQETSVLISLLIDVFADLKFVFALSVSGVSVAWAMTERIIRKKTVKRLHSRIKKLEIHIDPKRTSSGLTDEGDTNPDDMD
jgi:hypothetical protein